DFGNITDDLEEVKTAAKFHLKAQAKSRKASFPSRSLSPNPCVEKTADKMIGDAAASEGILSTPSGDVLTDSAVGRVSQNEDHGHDPSEVATYQGNLLVSDTQASSSRFGVKTIDDLVDFEGMFDTNVEQEIVAKFKPKTQVKLGKVASKSRKMDQKAVASTIDVASQSKDNNRAPRHQEYIQTSDYQPSMEINNIAVDKANHESILEEPAQEEADIDANIDLESQENLINPQIDDTGQIIGEPSATAEFQPNIGRKKGKGKSVTFILRDASKGVAPADTGSERSNTITEYTDRENQYHEGESSDQAVKKQPGLDVGKLELSMKLRSRKKVVKVGISEDATDNNFDDYLEALAVEQVNDSDQEYSAGAKQKIRRKSRDSTIEESQQQNLQKEKSEVTSRGRKRASKDTEEPEKKLTRRIRQNITKEVKTLLEKPDHETDRMKLSVMHLRLLQQARERIESKTIPSGPSASNQRSQFGDLDDFDPFGENCHYGRTESYMLENATKLNYHSYMNKQTRAKWSKSDTDLFYQGLQQYGSDFAMIQQLFPDKTRDQVRQKFKTEENKHPMQVHDAVLYRSRDNLYLKQVIKQLNIEDLPRDIDTTHKQECASNEGNPGNENVLDGFMNEEENGSNWSDTEQGTHGLEIKEGESVSANVEDALMFSIGTSTTIVIKIRKYWS
ncbi:hypothetical protein BRADI_3g11035v3, partial [Brachypodium distachyon]